MRWNFEVERVNILRLNVKILGLSMGILKDQTLELLKIDLGNYRLTVEIVRGKAWELSQIERGNFQRLSMVRMQKLS